MNSGKAGDTLTSLISFEEQRTLYFHQFKPTNGVDVYNLIKCTAEYSKPKLYKSKLQFLSWILIQSNYGFKNVA